MRSSAALTLCVSLAAAFRAAGQPATLTWIDLHDRGLAAIGNRDFQSAADLFAQSVPLAGNPLQRGLSSNDLGVTLHRLVRDSEARVQLETAFRIWRENPGQEVRLAQTAEALAAVNRTLGDYPAAEKILRAALQTPPSDPDNHALLLNELGDILREVGHSFESHQLLERTLALPGISRRRQLDAILGIADLDRDAHAWQASFEGWNKGLEIARERHWVSLEAAALRGLGVTFLDHGEPARSEPLLRRALQLFESQDVPGHQIASTLSCLAQLYQAEARFGMAEEVLLRAVGMDEVALGPGHPQVAVLLEMLGDAAAGRKQLAPALAYYEKARWIMTERFGERSPLVAAVNASLAGVEQRANHNAEAAVHLEKALAILNVAGPEVQPLRDSVLRRYNGVCKALHRKAGPAANTFGP
ncbi:MAG: tetratricopeptide repeat protein [Acidobacteriota bacterium]